MEFEMESLDLLNPSNLSEHYQHQLRQTISAYSPTQIVLGEALQNAIDAIVEADDGVAHKISINLDLDQRTVTVTDTGIGFPNDPSLLYLGGGTKRSGSRKLFGLVGVGIKVVLFSSKEFRIRARSDQGAFRYEISDAYQFEKDPPPNLQAPSQFPDDPSPLNNETEVYYRFPEHTEDNPVEQFIQNMYDQCLPRGNDSDFGKTLKLAVKRCFYENRMAGLMAAFLRRYTYAGDVLNYLGGKRELSNTTIHVHVTCSDPSADFGDKIGDLFDGKTQFSFKISPEYLFVSETCNWVPRHDRPGLFDESLGRGGTNLTRTWKGFNTCLYVDAEDYEKLLTDKNGEFPKVVKESIEEYRERLFPRINGILLTIGRINDFEEFLPGGSQRVISANGVVTTHEVGLTRGRTQQYARSFDLVIDVDAPLNYGKSQLTDNHLVSRIRRFVNDAYAATIQTAASNWVGRVNLSDDDEQNDFFLKRDDLGIPELAIKKVPRDENDVIALFFELLGRGYIEGYQSFGLSQMESFDGKFILRRSGDRTDPVIPADDRQLSAVEFKVIASSLIQDLEREAKNPRELKLVIAWDEGASNSDQFGFADIEHSRYYPDNVYPSVTRYLQDTRSGSQIQVLLLKSVVDNIRQTE
jgi:anti-sigma regulatory factor (Ser/Thr protein kinase)